MLTEIGRWMAINWLELVGVSLALAAIVHTQLLQRAWDKAASARSEADLMKLRLRANDAVSEVEKSFLALQVACENNRRNWKQYRDKHLAPLSSARFRRPRELEQVRAIEIEAYKLAESVRGEFSSIRKMSASELEEALHDTRHAALDISKLVRRLEEPQQIHL